jgi:hypothetical protein
MNYNIIKPETALESAIMSNPLFLQGASWGVPRGGHPEGQVIFHIEEVLNNVDKYSEGNTREKLRLIALIHDTFKFKVDDTKARHGENHHAMIARRFAEGYITDAQVLDVIELHDEAYNAWVKGKKSDWLKAEARLNNLIDRLGDALPLYRVFYRCDNETGNKRQDNFIWFESYLLGRNVL